MSDFWKTGALYQVIHRNYEWGWSWNKKSKDGEIMMFLGWTETKQGKFLLPDGTMEFMHEQSMMAFSGDQYFELVSTP